MWSTRFWFRWFSCFSWLRAFSVSASASDWSFFGPGFPVLPSDEPLDLGTQKSRADGGTARYRTVLPQTPALVQCPLRHRRPVLDHHAGGEGECCRRGFGIRHEAFFFHRPLCRAESCDIPDHGQCAGDRGRHHSRIFSASARYLETSTNRW